MASRVLWSYLVKEVDAAILSDCLRLAADARSEVRAWIETRLRIVEDEGKEGEADV